MIRDLWITARNAVSETWAIIVCRVKGHDIARYGPANEPWWLCNRCGVELP